MVTQHKTPQQAVQGDIVHLLNLNKFRWQYRGATGEVMKWHPDNIYTVLVNGMPVTVTGYEFTTTYRN